MLAGQEGVRTDQAHVRRPGKRLNSPERWEITQLIKAGVLDIAQYPTFDEEGQVRAAALHLVKGFRVQGPGSRV